MLLQTDTPAIPNAAPHPDDLSWVKLHTVACFLMTQFQQQPSAQLGQFIVRHIALLIEHPDTANAAQCRELYLKLLGQWQDITAKHLEREKPRMPPGQYLH